MANNLRIVPWNFHDEATLSTSIVSAAGFPASNTQNTRRSRVWLSSTNADQDILGTYADSVTRTSSHFSFFLHRCHGGNVQLRLYSDAAWTTLVYDSTVLPVYTVPTEGADWGWDPYGIGAGNDPQLLFAPFYIWHDETPHLSYRISFTDNVSTFNAPYWQVSRIWIGKFFEVMFNPSYGATLGYEDMTDDDRSRGGSDVSNVGAIWKTMDMTLDWINESERAMWVDIMERLGTGRNLVASWFPGAGDRLERDHTICGKFNSLDALGRKVSTLTKKLQFKGI